MSNQPKVAIGNKIKKVDDDPTFWEWLVHGKGTVSEPWPTVKEVLDDPEVQEEIKKVHSAFDRARQKSTKQKSGKIE